MLARALSASTHVDILTHGMMGVVLASPFLDSHPLLAGGIALGSTLPDADALSRLFGKRAFLRAHQTYSHALPFIALAGLLSFAASSWLELGFGGFLLGICLGMALHSLLDVTNTYGITLFAPFSSKRICFEWVFFIDIVVLAATTIAFAMVAQSIANEEVIEASVAGVYGLSMLAYFGLKAGLRKRCAGYSPKGTLALLPSAALPWEYFGCAREEHEVRIFRMNSITGSLREESRVPILDREWEEHIQSVPEVCAMRSLTPAFHVISATAIEARSTGVSPSHAGAPAIVGATRLFMKDLRTRNFGTRFGSLELVLASDGSVIAKEFHV
ncbi:MAG: membrane-bound metal-dependent hydrolase YbcI (DUF457 family) [Planctomycetota bacterium]|jgi:membrane-bound metal-dependent hydrolase YbcI (DUF457 family)